MRRFLKFTRLPGVEQRLLIRAVLLLWTLRIGLRTLPFRTVNAFVARRSQPRRTPLSPLPLARLIWILAAAGRLLPGSRTCLVRALAGSILVGGQGYSPNLRLGVARTGDGRLDAHAWLECDGQVLVGGTDLDRYSAFPSPSP
jgi:hypothetical protein